MFDGESNYIGCLSNWRNDGKWRLSVSIGAEENNGDIYIAIGTQLNKLNNAEDDNANGK